MTGLLRDHPDVFMSARKELHFFDFDFGKGIPWYKSHFELAGDQQAIGEATPNYMYFSETIPRIVGLLPGVRLVAILRNPVERAYSHYWHNRSTGREKLGFSDALAKEKDRLAADDPRVKALWSYADRGYYLRQLKVVEESVGRSHLLVLLFDDLSDNPTLVYRSLCEFLGVDEVEIPRELGRLKNRFVASRSRLLTKLTAHAPEGARSVLKKLNTRDDGSYPPMERSDRCHLIEGYEQANAALGSWLGRDLGEWSHEPR